MWWMSIGPGIAIFIAVFAFNFLGDAMRDWLDPQFRQTSLGATVPHLRISGP